ncbi:bifunctional glycosyltransferase family 2 protein/CDP-glycerol:glycerophosphate glycerophosphotransferase [Streptomyces sp. H10-C2]|uniref:bifunctional glycosyltransferase/CDP-glycerol:glycerophosphate glycerophosphotransferase n=1 Tax=unclassified Streptomyces TaxID=2593676 RepID=UPI0024B98487|nr:MULTISPECIES: bifunctional glycosyltransferase family 2 protein/CDP-glycerol:glycerophosphate glycerophosphotransferase [unclassified Streptomyces]MDJ0345720.1 bifunctional glycosyltransferase family 2 protein/CDP-glycerol:glycerophosphate glycerophosphotransferase [Streptomyces sp. PH10-H1]MDJ0374587.1 bifunctional glycosyltransferase family 2 protein/CDP-glycerol:glycerophosphate glycerophosphotransferase [Streptomyces sp. H10-C2]
MTPRLTVVVPVRNVEQYLEECLLSVAEQTLDGLEVVMVDNGSADHGPEIAQRFADRDPRFRLVRMQQQGTEAGTGKARNTGTRHADPRTTYLAFLNGDDLLPPRAYERLVALLDRSGSDIATGNVYRLTSRGRSQARQQRGMRETVRGTHITRDLTLLADRTVSNKVFRRTFWDEHALVFPEGVHFEDAPVTIRAHFLAEAVDVLHEHVVHRRIHEGLDTRRRTDVKGLRDRVAAVDGVSRFLARPGASPGLGASPGPGNTPWSAYKRDYDRSVLADDLLSCARVLPMAGPEYREVFLDRVRDFLTRVDPALHGELPVELRITWHLVREGRLGELLTVLAHQERNASGFTVAGPPLRRRAELPAEGGGTIRLPRATTALSAGDLPVRARLLESRWEDGKLVLTGYAYIRNLDASSRRRSLKTAFLTSGRRKLLLPLRNVPCPEATDTSGQEQHCYDWSGFEITVDPKRLRRGERWVAGQWRLGIAVATSGVVRQAAVRAGDSGSGASPLPHALGKGLRLVPWFKDGRLKLSVEPVMVRLTGHRALDDDGVELIAANSGDQQPRTLRLTHQASGTAFDYPAVCRPAGPAGSVITVRLSLADLAGTRPTIADGPQGVIDGATETWDAVFTLPDGRNPRIVLDRPVPPGRYGLGTDPRLGGIHRELVFEAGPAGNLALRDRTPQPLADRVVRRPDGSLLIEGDLPPATPAGAELVLKHGTHRAEAVFPVTADGDRFRVTVQPADAAPCEGRWYLHLRAAETDAPMRVAPAAFPALPLSLALPYGGRALALNRRHHDQLILDAGPAVPPEDHGPYRRRLLRERHYPQARGRELRDSVLYSSFDGRQYSDSPRAVHEELVRRGAALDHLWVVGDARVQLPPTARAVIHGSAAWHEALARSRHLVTNTHLPAWFQRREGQRVVQTWHGTPVKRIGQDLAGTLCADLSHLWPQPRRGHQWDVLISPNPYSTPLLRQALGYDGEVAETGLPRTDVFFADDRDKLAEEVRSRLGLPPGKRVVLYAPTQRDDQAYDERHYKLDLALDLAAAESALAADHVLLVRAHPLVADRVAVNGSGFARDVSGHPDLAELLLIADVLVTDYSSAMADFANTGRPMLFLTPDLDHYRDTLRGFYLDFEAQAPGPLLHSTADLIGALRDLDAVTRHSADNYAQFQAAFCPLDDGLAASRVADLLLSVRS